MRPFFVFGAEGIHREDHRGHGEREAMKRAGLSSAPSKTLNYSQASDAKDRVRMESPNAMAMIVG
jgi:hypothetical protein